MATKSMYKRRLATTSIFIKGKKELLQLNLPAKRFRMKRRRQREKRVLDNQLYGSVISKDSLPVGVVSYGVPDECTRAFQQFLHQTRQNVDDSKR